MSKNGYILQIAFESGDVRWVDTYKWLQANFGSVYSGLMSRFEIKNGDLCWGAKVITGPTLYHMGEYIIRGREPSVQ